MDGEFFVICWVWVFFFFFSTLWLERISFGLLLYYSILETHCCTQVRVPGQRSDCLPAGNRRVRAGVRVLLHTHPSPACTDGVPGTRRTARSPVLLKARGICLSSRSKRRGTEPGTPQCKLQHRGYRCGASRQCCRRMAPAHLPGAYTVYTLITQTVLGCLPPSKIQLHLPRKPTALHVPGISLPSVFCCEKFL